MNHLQFKYCLAQQNKRIKFSLGAYPKMCESLAQHQKTLTQGRQVQSVQKTKMEDIKKTAY